MAVFIDPRTGEQYANVPDEEQERARREFGLVTPEEYEQQQTAKAADESIGPLGTIANAAKRGVGARAEAIQNLTGFGTAPGLDEDEQGNKLPGGGLLQSAYTPEARADAAAHPVLAGIGQGLASGGEALLGGAALGAVAPVASALGTTVGAVVGEALPQAVLQEYDDAWLEQRPMQLQSVAANTLMFAGLDFAFRGALKGLGALGEKAAKPGAIGGRNVVSEAQGAARELVEPAGGGSVGAASAEDLAEPFDDAIRQMSDKDAAVLARDANDHLHLISQDASESFTRLNNGLSDNLGSQLKYEDFAEYAQNFEPKMLERQAEWFAGIGEQAEDAAQQIAKGPYNFGNLGAKAEQLISTFTRRIGEEADAGRRLVLGDEFKKRLDALTMSIDGSYGVDNVTRSELKSLIEPTREGLRKGLQNPKLFGGAADLQRSLNEPWHHLLESWRKVQSTLTEATGHVQFDVSGAGRITRESTVERMLGLLGKDPRSNQEFGKHLARSLEGIQGLIDARQAHGISRLDGLDEMASDIRNLMEDWNLASTIGVAKNRAAALAKDPRKWANIVANMAERLPMVGQPIQIARQLGSAFTDLHIEKGTPLARVWDSAYKRYALNPVYSDPSIIRNYPDWIAESLRQRGGNFTPPASGATGGVPTVPGMPPANANAERGVAQPGLSARGQAAVDRAKIRAEQGGYASLGHNSRLPKSGVEREASIELMNKRISRLPDVGIDDIPSSGSDKYPHAELKARLPTLTPEERRARSDYVGDGYELIRATIRGDDTTPHPGAKAFERVIDKLSIDNPTSRGPLYRGIKVDDDAINEILLSGEFNTSAPSSTSYNAEEAVSFATDRLQKGQRSLVIRFDAVDRGALINPSEAEVLLPRGGRFKVVNRQLLDGEILMVTVKQAGQASDDEMRRLGALGNVTIGDGPNFSLTDIAKSPMGVVTGAGAAGLAVNAAVQSRAAEPPQTPDHAYRDALREVDQAGTLEVRNFATAALRAKPPKGKDRDPLALFAGKGSIQDAVEESRERLDEIAGDPTSLLGQMGSSSGALSKTHPGVYMAVATKAAQVGAYLQSVIPKRTGVTLLDPRGAPVSFDRAWDYAARFVGATQPRAALREVVRGSAPPEMLESLAQNWPEVWDGFRAEMLGQVQRMHAAGKHISSEKLRRWDSMLGLRGQLDPSASLEVAQHFIAAQDADAAKRQQQAQGGGKAPAGGSARAALRTTLDSVNLERTAG